MPKGKEFHLAGLSACPGFLNGSFAVACCAVAVNGFRTRSAFVARSAELVRDDRDATLGAAVATGRKYTIFLVSRFATVYEVLIASPGDVQQEREILVQALAEWNSAHSRATGIILQPLRWEFDAVPSLGEDAQSIITEEIVRDADILMGVFWTRLGTRTNKSPSGTVEEIEHFRATGKKVLLYFSQANLPYDHDPEQLRRLKEYKEQLRPRALLWDFRDFYQLKNDSSKHLAKAVNELSRRNTWTILSPRNGAIVSATVQVSGAVGQLSFGNRAWLVVELESGHLYPQCRIRSPDVTYTESVRIGIQEPGKSAGQKFTIRLVCAGFESDYQFEKYIRGESRQKDWLYRHWPSDTQIWDSVSVTRGN